MSAIRVLHVDSERTWRGGERQVLELMRRQRAMGDEPHLAAPESSALLHRAVTEGFAAHGAAMRGTWDVASALRIASITRAIRPHVVHWHAARAHALGAIAAIFARGPKLVLSRRVDFRVRGSLGSRLLYALPVDAIVAISDGVKDALLRSGVPPGAIRVIPSGIDFAPFEGPFDRTAARARLGIAAEQVLAIQVAALAPHKSQTTLLQAMTRLRERSPRLVVWIAGEGNLRESLAQEHARLNLGDRVRFLGFRDDVPALLRSADLFVLSSYLEGLGTSVLDAMAAGLPVVATRVGGVPEIVKDQETGLLVPPRDPEALAQALARLADDPEMRARLGREGRSLSRDFDADQTASRTRELYLEVLGGGSPADPPRSP